MALSIRWSSTAQTGRIVRTPAPVDPVSRIEVEALFVAWEASEDKGGFIAGISLAQASALCDLIVRRVPATYPQTRPRTPNYGMGGKQRAARKRRIAELLGVELHQTLVNDVYAELASEYGACPVPRLITAEMVAAARRLGGRAKR